MHPTLVCHDQGVSPNADDPQIGSLDVDSVALLGTGESLVSLLEQLGVEFADGSRDDVPADGWRVLRRQDSGGVVIGAPEGASAATWRVAQIGVDQFGAPAPPVSVYPESLPVRRSRVERARGLVLRWAPLSQDEAANGVFVIDIVNTGEARWRPDGDPFLVIGDVRAPGTEDTVTSFGFFGGQNPAVPLDPGEYARVHVSINESQWRPLQPGRYELHAMLAMLPVATTTPLPLELTQEQIDQHRTRFRSRARTPAEEAEDLRQNHRRQKALVESAGVLEEIARLVTNAATVDEAAAAVELLLHADAEAATAVVHTPLMQFTTDAIRRTRDNVLRIERRLVARESENPGDGALE